MTDWPTAAIAAGAALLSSGLTGTLGLLAARRHARTQKRDELAASLHSYCYATDLMNLEIEQLPPPSSSFATALQSTAARLPTLDYTLGQISRRMLGRKAQHALDTYLAAFNRLMLIAPLPVLQTMEAINALLARVDERHSATWPKDWSTARGALAAAGREAIQDPPAALGVRRARREVKQWFRRSSA